jgi:hypothetical protein
MLAWWGHVMARSCTVCSHEQYAAIDAELLARTSYGQVAPSYGLSPDAVAWHRESHVQPVDQGLSNSRAGTVQFCDLGSANPSYPQKRIENGMADRILAQLKVDVEQASAAYATAPRALSQDARLLLAGGEPVKSCYAPPIQVSDEARAQAHRAV